MLKGTSVGFFVWVVVVAASTAFAQELTIDPVRTSVCAGGTVTFTPRKGPNVPLVTWDKDYAIDLGMLEPGPAVNTVKYTAPDIENVELTEVPDREAATIKEAVTRKVWATEWLSATSTDGNDESAWAEIDLLPVVSCRPGYGGEIVRATLGFEQIGAAGTPSDQKLSFDFFISRPIPIGHGWKSKVTNNDFYFGPPIRWWGDVRIGSYPQQINSDLATFSQNFVTNVGKVQVNKLVQSAEFLTGPEVRLATFSRARNSVTESIGTRYELMTYLGFGSIGPFSPGDDPAVFAVPAAPTGGAAASAQYTAFHGQYPSIDSKYVSFVPPDHTQFSKQWSAGVRLYTFYTDMSTPTQPLSKPPASVEIGIGQNRYVAPNGDATWRASAYFPFALGDRTKQGTAVIYFFGDVTMRLNPNADSTKTLFLAPAVDSSSLAIPITNPDVTLVPAPASHRDTYRVGVSVDLLKIWDKLSTPAPAK